MTTTTTEKMSTRGADLWNFIEALSLLFSVVGGASALPRLFLSGWRGVASGMGESAVSEVVTRLRKDIVRSGRQLHSQSPDSEGRLGHGLYLRNEAPDG